MIGHMTTKQMAERIGCSQLRVRRWIKRAGVPVVRVGVRDGGKIFVPIAHFFEMIGDEE